jgi:Carbohydrate binding domain/Tetratricopeptide repeat
MELRSPFSKMFGKILFLLMVSCYIGIVVRDSVASRLASSGEPQGIKQAVVLDPGNARYRNRLGEYFLFSEQRPDLAVPQYQFAASLNPHIAEYWLDLASAYFSTGAFDQQQQALERALEVDPHTPSTSRQVANAFFSRGDSRKALKIYRVLLEADPWSTESILEICWQGTHDIDLMSEVLPPTPNVRLVFLNQLIAEERGDEARQVWSRLIALQKPFDPALAKPYLEYLIAQKDINGAHTAWTDLGRVNASFRPYLPAGGNLVVNSGFEEKFFNMGFDWSYAENPHAVVAVDPSQFHTGKHSLSVTFNGDAVANVGLSQLVPADANSSYDFTAYAKAEDISTAAGPHLAVSDAYTMTPLLLTEELQGTTDWKRLNGSFRTGPNTNLLSVRILRVPGTERITGKLWIDDIAVVKQ